MEQQLTEIIKILNTTEIILYCIFGGIIALGIFLSLKDW